MLWKQFFLYGHQTLSSTLICFNMWWWLLLFCKFLWKSKVRLSTSTLSIHQLFKSLLEIYNLENVSQNRLQEPEYKHNEAEKSEWCVLLKMTSRKLLGLKSTFVWAELPTIHYSTDNTTPLWQNTHKHVLKCAAIVGFLIWRVCLQERSTCCLRRTMRRHLWWRSGLWWGSTRRLRATWPPTRTEWSRSQPSLKSWSKTERF